MANRTHTSANEELLEQVYKQLDVCDFTVTVGTWTKRFHSRVLITCPYFEILLSGRWAKSGPVLKAELPFKSHEAVEIAIMFLYGLHPKVDYGNVTELVSVAEFLSIPGLKKHCEENMDNISFNTCNLPQQLELMTTYDIHIPKANKYMSEHADLVLEGELLFPCSKMVITTVFETKYKCYVPTDTKLDFLNRWTRHDSSSRESVFEELCMLLNLDFVSKPLLESVREFAETAGLDNLKTKIELCLENTKEVKRMRNILYTVPKDGALEWEVCDLSTQRWYMVPNQMCPSRGTRRDHWNIRAFGINRHSDINVCMEDEGNIIRCNLFTNGFKVVAYTIDEEGKVTFHVQDGPLDHINLRLKMKPVFTLRDSDGDIKLSMNYSCPYTDSVGDIKLYMDYSCMCALSSKTKLYLFDTETNHFDTLEITVESTDNIVPFGDGCVIHNNERAICFQKMPTNEFKHHTVYLPKQGQETNIIYRLVHGLWLRFQLLAKDHVVEIASERFSTCCIPDLSSMTWNRCTFSNKTDFDWKFFDRLHLSFQSISLEYMKFIIAANDDSDDNSQPQSQTSEEIVETPIDPQHAEGTFWFSNVSNSILRQTEHTSRLIQFSNPFRGNLRLML